MSSHLNHHIISQGRLSPLPKRIDVSVVSPDSKQRSISLLRIFEIAQLLFHLGEHTITYNTSKQSCKSKFCHLNHLIRPLTQLQVCPFQILLPIYHIRKLGRKIFLVFKDLDLHLSKQFIFHKKNISREIIKIFH